MATISDVAKRAGVSTMTVSRVTNNSGYISQETRERVLNAINELGYVPNALARSLRFKQTKTIALVITDITNPFFTTLARGVEDVASERGFSVIFCNTDESPETEAEYLTVLLQKQVDGFLVVPACSSSESIADLQERNVPVVVLDRRVPDLRVDTVRGDSEQGAYLLVRHLLDLGHRRIAVLSGPQDVSTAMDRVAGYRRAMAEADIQGEDALEYYFDRFTAGGGYKMAQQALALNPRPTAIFAANNFVAIGAFHAFREAGLRVPEDISLVVIDDLPEEFLTQPFMTTANQPAYDLGEHAIKLLLSRLSGAGPDEPQEIVLPLTMIVRHSTCPPAQMN